jgi:hypothetical protein
VNACRSLQPAWLTTRDECPCRRARLRLHRHRRAHAHPGLPRDTVPRHPDGSLPDAYPEFPDPYVALAFIAARTSLRIAVGIALVAQHDPIALAKTVATLDAMSGGRLVQEDPVAVACRPATGISTLIWGRTTRTRKGLHAQRFPRR